MTKSELINTLKDMDDDHVVIIMTSEGWTNIEKVVEWRNEIQIHMDEDPVFTD